MSFLKLAILLFVLGTASYFFITRVSILLNRLLGRTHSTSHIYWVYTNPFLIWLVDRKILVNALLLFNYNKMVDKVVGELNPSLNGKSVLQVSCAFGDLTGKVLKKCIDEDVGEIVISDIVPNEVRHMRRKLRSAGKRCRYILEDATNLSHPDKSFDYVILFFLFHELPYEKKILALKEAARVCKPGGKIVFGEFHKPEPIILNISGYIFFKVFEPYAHEMWAGFSPEGVLMGDTEGKWSFERAKFFGANYQVMTATKL